MIVLFFVGIIEMVIVSVWTKVVTDSKIIASGVVTIINILIWYYVLEKVVSDIGNWKLVVLYAFGCAIGTMLTTAYYKHQEKKMSPKKEDINKVIGKV